MLSSCDYGKDTPEMSYTSETAWPKSPVFLDQIKIESTYLKHKQKMLSSNAFCNIYN
jgi:hypothetical protein